jgi:hypothetical protein
MPTLAVLIGVLMNAIQFNSVNARFSGLEGTVNARFNSVDARFNSLESRFNSLDVKLDVKFDTLTGKVIDLDNRVTRIEAKLGIG